MSVLDLDFYKLTMLQFIWKHYADVPVTFLLHSRKQDLRDVIIDHDTLRQYCTNYFYEPLGHRESDYLEELGIFDPAFIRDLDDLFNEGLATPVVSPDGVYVTGNWFKVSLWETVILSAVSEQYSVSRAGELEPDDIKRYADIYAIGTSGAKWADFGTRRRFSYHNHYGLIDDLAYMDPESRYGFIGTSNVHFAHQLGLKPIGTYAHELEMVLRTQFPDEYSTTHDVLSKWGAMYPRELRIALTDTYTTPNFLRFHGKYLLDNDWRGVRLDSGNPKDKGIEVAQWLWKNAGVGESWDVVFSDGLTADKIVDLQSYFSDDYKINPVFGWGTGLTNPNSDLSLVMKATEANGQKTYKITDDNEKSIR